MHSLSDYDYTLPEHLIAQTPADPPESCKFLVYDKHTGAIQDKVFSDITHLIDPETLIVFNNTKVLKARLQRTTEPKHTPSPSEAVGRGLGGGKPLEIFYLSSSTPYTFNALVRPGKKFKVGSTIHFNDDISFTVDKVTYEGRQLTCNQPIQDVLETYGHMPLPPYISYDESKADPYQPVFASKAGSVAAPTASLHFTKGLIQDLENIGVQTAYTTLHVGLGTFKQVDTETIQNYDIHAETIEIDLSLFERIATHKLENKPLLAVGTTITRTLESLPYLRKIISQQHKPTDSPLVTRGIPKEERALWGEGGVGGICISKYFDEPTTIFRNNLTSSITLEQSQKIILSPLIRGGGSSEARDGGVCSFQTKLFLYPGKPFYLIDQLITNFHLPKSSLLMLVAGYIGYDEMKQLYDHAIAEQYRFYSFGDAMRIK